MREKEQISFARNVLGAYFAELEALTKCADSGKPALPQSWLLYGTQAQNNAAGENFVNQNLYKRTSIIPGLVSEPSYYTATSSYDSVHCRQERA